VITRRLREWPRATVAVAVLAVGLVLIGVLLASTGSGGSARAAAQPPAARGAAAGSTSARALSVDRATIARLKKSLTQESSQVASARSALTASEAESQCWQGKARHPRKERAVKCETGSGT